MFVDFHFHVPNHPISLIPILPSFPITPIPPLSTVFLHPIPTALTPFPPHISPIPHHQVPHFLISRSQPFPISPIPLHPQYSHQPYSSINLIALSPQFSIISIFSYTQFPQHSHHSHHTSAQFPSPQFSNHPVFSFLEHNHSPISPTSHHPQLLPFITLIPPSTQFPYHPHFSASLSPNPHTLPTSIPFPHSSITSF